LPQLATLPISHRCLLAALLAMGCHAPASHAGPDFSRFLADFRHALAENDGARVAALTRLPFLYEGRGAGDVAVPPFSPSTPSFSTPPSAAAWLGRNPLPKTGPR